MQLTILELVLLLILISKCCSFRLGSLASLHRRGWCDKKYVSLREDLDEEEEEDKGCNPLLCPSLYPTVETKSVSVCAVFATNSTHCNCGSN